MARRNSYEDVFKHIDIQGVDDCWIWKGSINRKGIPYIAVDGRKYIAYRLVKWLTDGNFNLHDESIVPMHQCKDSNGNPIDNPLCCNPAHTIMGSHEENMLDMMMKGRSGLTKDAIRDIIKIHQEFPELSHGQIAARVEYKYQVKCARQTITDILNKRRRSVLQQVIQEEDEKQ